MKNIPVWREKDRIDKLTSDFESYYNRTKDKIISDTTEEFHKVDFKYPAIITIFIVAYLNIATEHYLTGLITPLSILYLYGIFRVFINKKNQHTDFVDFRTDIEIKEEKELYERQCNPNYDRKIWLIENGALNTMLYTDDKKDHNKAHEILADEINEYERIINECYPKFKWTGIGNTNKKIENRIFSYFTFLFVIHVTSLFLFYYLFSSETFYYHSDYKIGILSALTLMPTWLLFMEFNNNPSAFINLIDPRSYSEKKHGQELHKRMHNPDFNREAILINEGAFYDFIQTQSNNHKRTSQHAS